MGGELIAVRGRPVAAMVLATVGLVLLAVAWGTGESAWASWSSLPFLLAMACAMTPEPRFEGRLLADRIEVRRPLAASVPYSEIRWIAARRRALMRKDRPPRIRTIYVQHSMGLLAIPTRTDAFANEVLDSLAQRVGYRGGPYVAPALESYLRGQTELFGAERVYTYRARGLSLPHGGKRLALCGLACWLAYAVISFTGTAKGDERMLAGCWLIGGGILLGLLALAHTGRMPSSLGSASLVISPQGFALSQADVMGELKWSEVRALAFGRSAVHSRSFQVRGPASALMVRVEGAEIAVFDCYDRPIEMIQRVLALYSKGVAKCGVCGTEIRAPAGPGCAVCAERRVVAERAVS